MKTKACKIDMKLKNGTVIPAGTVCTLEFDKSNPAICLITPTGFPQFRGLATRLPKYFAGISVPSLRTIQKWEFDFGICKSIFGARVEPDGWDSDGSPSWMLALRLI